MMAGFGRVLDFEKWLAVSIIPRVGPLEKNA
jgi:hypothetical protein